LVPGIKDAGVRIVQRGESDLPIEFD